MTGNCEGWIELVRLQQLIDRRSRLHECRIIQRSVAIHRCKSGRQQQRIALPERNVEMVSQRDHHLAGWCGAPAFDEAQMLLLDLSLCCGGELAQVTLLPPGADECTD
jgi:hypothetical protein